MPTVITQRGGALHLDGAIRCKVFCFTAGQISVNQHDFAYEFDVGTNMFAGEVAKAFADTVAPNMTAILTADTQVLGVKVEEIQNGTPFLPGIAYANVFGTRTDLLLPQQDSLVITKQSGTIGRHARGRFYVPFPSVSAMTDRGEPDAAYVALCQQVGDDILTFTAVVGLTATYTFRPIITQRAFGSTRYPIVAMRANARWGTQRRRSNYGRLNPPIIV